MFSWVIWLIKSILRLFGLGGHSGRGIDLGAAPTLTAPTVATIPASLQNAIRFALDGERVTSAEIDLGTISTVDLDPQKALADIGLIKDLIANQPAKVKELLSSVNDLRKAQEILREIGFEREYQQGNLITGALTLARIWSVGNNTRVLSTGESAPTRGAKTYLPLEPLPSLREEEDAVFLGMESGGIASILFKTEVLVKTEEEQSMCLADAEMVETAIVEHAEQFAQIYENFHDDDLIKSLVYQLGLDEESTSSKGGGLGCLTVVVIIVVVLLVCVWYVFSDKTAKAEFAPVDVRDILRRLATVPVETWTYRTQESSARHIGPMAQDFHAAFGVGEDDRYISTVDASGVALAAIQGLSQLLQDKDAEMDELNARLSSLEETLNTESDSRDSKAP